MSWYRRHSFFASALTLLALVALAEVGWIWKRATAAREALRQLTQKRAELRMFASVVPSPTAETATLIDADLAQTDRVLAGLRTALQGHRTEGDGLAPTKPPAGRADAFFDLATFAVQARSRAKASGVAVKADEHFGFSAYANEGPDRELIAPVLAQRVAAEDLVEALIDAHPRALLAVRRERPRTRAEHAALVAAALGDGVVEAASSIVPSKALSADYLEMDSRLSSRQPGLVETNAFQVVFTGQTAVLRAFLNRLASHDHPFVVRSVEVETATAENSGAFKPDASGEPASVSPGRGTNQNPDGNSRRDSTTIPLVTKPFSKFTVVVEFIELVSPGDTRAANLKPKA